MSTEAGVDTFDLATRESDVWGRGVSLDGSTLAWGADRRGAFGDIAAIEHECEMGGDDPGARCDIFFAGGGHLTVHLNGDKPAEIAVYRAFVLTLLQRLGPAERSRIVFREGDRPFRRAMNIGLSGFCLAVALVGFVVAAFSRDVYEQPNEWLALPLLLLFIVVLSGMLWASLKSGQKQFDPEAIPAAALPAPPRETR